MKAILLRLHPMVCIDGAYVTFIGFGAGEKELSDSDLPFKMITANNAKYVVFCLRQDER